MRLPSGTLVQGMAGSLDPGPTAASEGHVAKHFSADGTHLIFGSRSQFEPDANNDGDITIYSRDLDAGTDEGRLKDAGGRDDERSRSRHSTSPKTAPGCSSPKRTAPTPTATPTGAST